MSDDYNVKVGLMRNAGRNRIRETGDHGAGVFAMVRDQRILGATDAELQQAVEDLRKEGLIPGSSVSRP